MGDFYLMWFDRGLWNLCIKGLGFVIFFVNFGFFMGVLVKYLEGEFFLFLKFLLCYFNYLFVLYFFFNF